MTQLPQPLHDRVLIAISAPETITSSGIIIPDTATETPLTGTILAVGPGRPYEDTFSAKTSEHPRLPMDVEPGDYVLFSKYGGTQFTFAGQEYMVISQTEILVTLPSPQ